MTFAKTFSRRTSRLLLSVFLQLLQPTTTTSTTGNNCYEYFADCNSIVIEAILLQYIICSRERLRVMLFYMSLSTQYGSQFTYRGSQKVNSNHQFECHITPLPNSYRESLKYYRRGLPAAYKLHISS